MRTAWPLLSLLLLLPLAACEDDALQEVHPRLLVCSSAEVSEASCGGPVDLGELPLETDAAVELWAHNRGAAPLEVASVASEGDEIELSPTAFVVGVGGAQKIAVRVRPAQLGPREETLHFLSDDPESPERLVPVSFVGAPKPAPRLQLCLEDAPRSSCGTQLEVDFGPVRPTQAESRTLLVRNVGDAALELEEVELADEASVAGELRVVTSTRPGALAPGEQAPIVVVYQPADAHPDRLTLTFRSNDAEATLARAVLVGSSPANAPPVALAAELESAAPSVEAKVGELVVLDGRASFDPEGDPLGYAWTLAAPAGSAAALAGETAPLATFTPDVVGLYEARLHVEDSLGQQSAVAAVVEVQALPTADLRVRLSWSGGGDVDLHLVPAGDDLFGATDAHFENPRPDLGEPGEHDDPALVVDAESAPGSEELVFEAPPAGTFSVYAHYWDDHAEGPAPARVQVILFDESPPALDEELELPAGCALWHVGDVTFPGGELTPAEAMTTSTCP